MRIVKRINNSGFITNKTIREMFNRSDEAALKEIKKLLSAGVVKSKAEGVMLDTSLHELAIRLAIVKGDKVLARHHGSTDEEWISSLRLRSGQTSPVTCHTSLALSAWKY